MRNIRIGEFRRAAQTGERIYLNDRERVVASGRGVSGWWRGRQVRQEVSGSPGLRARGRELLERFRQSVKEHYGKDCYAQLNWSRTWGEEAGGLAADEVTSILQEADGVVSGIEELNRRHRDAFFRLAESENLSELSGLNSPGPCLQEIVYRCLRENGLDPEWVGPWNEGLWGSLMMENLPGFRFVPMYSRRLAQIRQREGDTEAMPPLKLYASVEEIAERASSAISAWIRLVAQRERRLPFWWKVPQRAAFVRLMFHPSMASIRPEWREDALGRFTSCMIHREADRRESIPDGVFFWEMDVARGKPGPHLFSLESRVWHFFFNRPLPCRVTSGNLCLHLYQVIRINDIRSRLAREFSEISHPGLQTIFLNWTRFSYLRGVSGFKVYETLVTELKTTLEQQGRFLPFSDPAAANEQRESVCSDEGEENRMSGLRFHPSLAEVPDLLRPLVLAILSDVYRANRDLMAVKMVLPPDPGEFWQWFFRGYPPPETLRTDNLVSAMLGQILMDHPPRSFPGATERDFVTVPFHSWIFLIHSDGLIPWVIRYDLTESIRYLIGHTGVETGCRYHDALLLETVKQKKAETLRLVLTHRGGSDSGRHHAMIQVLGEGDRKFLRLLLQNGIRATTRELTLAIQNEFPECVDLILQFCPELLHAVNSRNDTPLQSAYYQGHVPTLEVLLKNGADAACLINDMGELQSDMHSWRIPHPAFIRLLVEMGAGVYSILDRIYRESQYGPPRPAELLVLLEHGVDPNWRFPDNRVTLNGFAVQNAILLEQVEISRTFDLHRFVNFRWTLIDDYRKRLDDEIFNDESIRISGGRELRVNRRLLEARIGRTNPVSEAVWKRFSEGEVRAFLRWVYSGFAAAEEEKKVRRICLDLGIGAREFGRKTGPKGFTCDMVGLFGQEETRDFTVVVQGHPIRVHQMVLAARSELFWNMFATVRNDSSRQVHDTSSISPAAWRVMIRYMYTGRLELGELRKHPKVVGELLEHHGFFLLHPNEENRENPFSLIRKLEEYIWLLKN